MYGTRGRFHHNRFARLEILNRKDTIGLYLEIFGKTTVEGYAIGAQVLAQEEIPPHAVKTSPAHCVAVGNDSLPGLKTGNAFAQLDNFAGKFVPRNERKTRRKFSFVHVKVSAAKTASMDPYSDFIGGNLRVRGVSVREIARSVVNNGFHRSEGAERLTLKCVTM
jgi:hypothetical protein